ncbi:uncharacterized protein BXZ73DRAFT_90052 [Epithele typhae]|uniref:uncharacterized protein n=1 Tax=Epithele typhae TaxID=378194 RepID=UPI0020076573|nr:uncharacterized protein BXZ73DRAFT_90052 [Epithele typhae]KAH9932136.1 hypothetical protein BXZ73DRAFT_90052 [Epithele typhae]
MPYAGPSSDPSSSATATASLPRPFHRRSRSSGNFSDERGPGAFAGLGQLPRLNKKAVFRINDDNDDDNVHDDERPFSPYANPYSPLNSLRLSMNAGKFSPSIQPPPRIEIPPLEPPAAVPFPTSSPTSPSSGPLLFATSLSRESSRSSTASLPRTPSTPIILSNGKPLKSSLKSSASSPNISDLPIKHIRAQSAPSTPSMNKNVHFAEKDEGLETVRVYNRTGKPASLSKPPGEETETETELENSSSFPFPILPSSLSSTSSAALVHEIDPALNRTNPIPKSNPSPYANVFLETLSLPKTRPPTLRGTILARNVSFEKTVAVRFTLDDWQTTSEVMCKHVVSLPGLPPPFPRARTMGDVAGNLATGQPKDEEKEPAGPTWDRFSFTIRLEDYEAKLSERTLFLVVRYNPGCGGEWWDNNDNANYRVGFRRAAVSPLPSPSLANSQQRTFSAPSTLRATPTTGVVGSPYAPPTRQLAPAPPQLVRSTSSPYPVLTPSTAERDQKERERMSEKGLGAPTAAYLARKLSFSNYVSPASAGTSMVTPPTTPPGTVRMRSASLPMEVGISADGPKEEEPKEKKEEHPTDTVQGTDTQGGGRPRTCKATHTFTPQEVSAPVVAAVTIPGPSPDALSQARTSYGFEYGSSPPALALGFSVPRTSSPRPISPSTEAQAAVESINTAVRELGLGLPGALPPTRAALRQWCFAQSSPPPQSLASTPMPMPTPSEVPMLKSGENTPKAGFGALDPGVSLDAENVAVRVERMVLDGVDM